MREAELVRIHYFFTELENKIREKVEEEEDRILMQRQKLYNLRHELTLKELELMENVKSKALEKKLNKRESQLDRLLKEISKRVMYRNYYNY